MTQNRIRKYPRIGDVLEASISAGLRYVQYTHWHEQMGALVRVLPGVFQERPQDISDIISGEHQYVTFCLLRRMVASGILVVIDHLPVPSSAQHFLIFRSIDGGGPHNDWKGTWWFWDGQRSWPVGEALGTKERSIPLASIPDEVLFVEYLNSDWTPEKDYEPYRIAEDQRRHTGV